MPITEEIEGTGPGPDDVVEVPETEAPAETPDADVEETGADGESPEGTEDEGADGEGDGSEPPKPGTDGKLDFVIEGDEPAPTEKKSADKAFGHLRKSLAATQKEAAELRRQLAQLQAPNTGVADPGPEPTEESCGYDANKLKIEYLEWTRKKAAFEDVQKKAIAEAEQAQRDWLPIRQTCQTSRDAIASKTEDFESAEVAYLSALTPLRQGIIMDLFPERYGELVYVLGRNPDRLKLLVEQKNEARFIRELIKLEAKVKPKDKPQKTPTPDRPVSRGSGAGGPPIRREPGVDPHLESLRKQAEKSGDYTAVNEYKRSKRERAA